MFVGLDCCGSRVSSTPTLINEITYVSISNGIYDELFGSDNPNIEMNEESKKWDYDTRFYARFEGNLFVGNVDYVASMVSSVRIKRRKNNEHAWITLFEIPIKTNDDFQFELVDRYAQGSQDYYYALIPVIENVEGNINKNSIHSEFDNYFILDRDVLYPIMFNTGLNIELNKNIGVINTLGRKYPFVISNGMNKYKTGALDFTLIPIVDCEINTDDIYNYRTQFEEWINNGEPKILKDWTGQIYMIDITGNISVDLNYYQMPSYKIQFTEIGDPLNSDDLYNNNFTNIVSALYSNYPE